MMLERRLIYLAAAILHTERLLAAPIAGLSRVGALCGAASTRFRVFQQNRRQAERPLLRAMAIRRDGV